MYRLYLNILVKIQLKYTYINLKITTKNPLILLLLQQFYKKIQNVNSFKFIGSIWETNFIR